MTLTGLARIISPVPFLAIGRRAKRYSFFSFPCCNNATKLPRKILLGSCLCSYCKPM
nr:MAG: hypothetical protein [Microvirus sp.]